MFKKINCVFSDSLIKKITQLTKYIDKQPCELYGDPSPDGYSAETDDERLVIDYYSRNQFCKFLHYYFNNDNLLNDFPFHLFKETPTIRWQVVTGGKELPAHVDLLRKCAINLYINSNKETTIFYERKRQGVFLKEKQNKYISNELFVPEWVEPIGHFIANNLDMYILDTTIPHSVTMNDSESKRIAITFSFYKMSFEEVIKCFKN
jgi:hypothetical protein